VPSISQLTSFGNTDNTAASTSFYYQINFIGAGLNYCTLYVIFDDAVVKAYTLFSSGGNTWTGPNVVSGLNIGVNKELRFSYSCEATAGSSGNKNSIVYIDNVLWNWPPPPN
jgi:hypothetical protein